MRLPTKRVGIEIEEDDWLCLAVRTVDRSLRLCRRLPSQGSLRRDRLRRMDRWRLLLVGAANADEPDERAPNGQCQTTNGPCVDHAEPPEAGTKLTSTKDQNWLRKTCSRSKDSLPLTDTRYWSFDSSVAGSLRMRSSVDG
jgi:hypothetical protein